MPEIDDELMHAPVPPQVPRLDSDGSKTAASQVPLQRSEPKEFEPRPGDSGEDRPVQAPPGLAPLSAADRQALVDAEERLLQKELREAEEMIANEPALLGLSAWITHPLLIAIALGMAAVVGIFVFNQLAQALLVLGSLQGIWMYAGYAVLGLMGAAVAYAGLRIVWLYMRLRRNRQLRIEGLAELERRTRLRWLVNAKLHEAKQQLQQYLRDYPLGEERERRRLLRLGLSESVLIELGRARDRLLDADRWPSDDVWFEHFRTAFQSHLDDAGAARVNYWARRAAVGTAVSPNAVSDTMMTLYFSFTLLSDLCRIYNLRAGRLGTAVMLARVFFNAYLAGQVQEMEHMTADQIQQLVAPHIPASEILLAKVLGKMGAKASAGVVNFFLLNRLGRYGCRMLRPVMKS